MKKAGRAILPVIILLVVIFGGGALFFLASSSPSSVANDFLVALAKGDTKGLADLGYIEGLNHDQAEKVWQKTIDRAMYYRFVWNVKNSREASNDRASVSLEVVRNADMGASYPDDYELPIVKVDGKWRVDVHSIPRAMYPALPH